MAHSQTLRSREKSGRETTPPNLILFNPFPLFAWGILGCMVPYLGVGLTEGGHIQEGGEGDVSAVLPQLPAHLHKPLQVEVEHQWQSLYQQLLHRLRVDNILRWFLCRFFLQ